MNPILQVFYSLLSGLSLSLALPNEIYKFGNPVISFFVIIPFYFAIRNSKSYWRSFLNGFVFTCSTHLASSFWLSNFKDFAALTLGASAFGTGMIGAFLSLFMYLPFADSYNPLRKYALKLKFYENPAFKIIYFASIYTLYEWVKSCGYLGYPWGTLSSTVFKFPVLMQIASITGTYGVTFLLVLINGILGELIFYINHKAVSNNRNIGFYIKTAVKLTLILYVVTLLHGVYNYCKKINPQKTLNTVIVQQNSDPWKEVSDEASILVSEQLSEEKVQDFYNEEQVPELIVWSEGTLQRRFPGSYRHYLSYPEDKPIVDFVKELNTPLLTGGSYVKSFDDAIFFNAAIMFDQDGRYRGFYGKNHLVPFAEAIPGIEIPAIRSIMEKVIGISAGWTPGDQYTSFSIPCSWAENYRLPAYKNIDLSESYQKQKENDNKRPVVQIATPICFDDSFPDIIGPMFKGGAELFVNITDDSWSLTESSEYQHFVVASYRAIEYRTTMVRSCNAGYSVVINPQGKVLADLPLFQKAALSYKVPVYEHKYTTYARFGNWLPYTILAGLFIFSITMKINFVSTDYISSEALLFIKKSHKKNKKTEKKKDSKSKSDKKKKNSKDKSKKHSHKKDKK